MSTTQLIEPDTKTPQPESPFLPDGRRWLWSAHSLDAIICPRKGLYASMEGLVAKSKKDDLIFGSHYSTALERYHRERALGTNHEDATRYVVAIALSETWGWQSNHNAKNREGLIRSIVWYLDEYEDDPCKTIILSDGRPAAELDFRFQLSDEIWLRGRIDRLVEYAGEIYVQDQKTTGSFLGSYYFKRYSPNTQMSLYTAAAQIVFATLVKGVMIDVAQIAVGFTRFERGFTFRTPSQIDEWLAHVRYKIERFWDAAKHNYPLEDGACMMYGGCDFREVCSKDPSVRNEFLATGFEEHQL